MTAASPQEVTRLLAAWSDGDEAALEQLPIQAAHVAAIGDLAQMRFKPYASRAIGEIQRKAIIIGGRRKQRYALVVGP